MSELGKLRAVIFDLDGTLVDSRRDIAEAANHALEKSGRARLSHAELESYVGDGAPLLLARAARLDVSDPRTAALVTDFLDYYAAHPVDHTEVMPGTLEALDALADLALGVCTNKPRITSVAVLEGLGLAARFHSVVAGDDLPERKPHPSMVQEAARKLGVSVSEVVMVGDGPQDIESGRAAGARTVGVRGGIQAIERLVAAGPDLLIDTLADLPAALVSLGSAR
ncbi:MAG: putative phosphoglycolate phosphatase [Polyangiaceae bacterium]|nr:putative phosphoglycolate phosphatase [Polyangiaceae bacterium]